MTENDQIAQALQDALQMLALMEELLIDASDALWRMEQEALATNGEDILLPPSDADGSTACR